MMKMNATYPVIVLTILAVVLPASVSAADQPIPGDNKNPLRPGSWSAQFQISENFTLNDFQGAMLSVKRHRSARTAYRFGLNLALEVGDNDRISSVFEEDSLTSSSEVGIKNEQKRVQLDFQFLRYSDSESTVKWFWGVGPLVRFTRLDNDQNDYTGRSEALSQTWAVGASGLIGVEWFPARAISLHAEYGAEMRYSQVRQERTEFPDSYVFTRKTEETDKIFAFDARSVLFGLSVYF